MKAVKSIRILFSLLVMVAVVAGLIYLFNLYTQRQAAEKSVVPRVSPSLGLAQDMLAFARPDTEDHNDYYRPIPQITGRFAVPDNLRPVVDFWKRVYTGIYSFQAIVHDNRDVNLVYAIIDLRDEKGGAKGDYDSVTRAAKNVLKRYKSHMKYLLKSKYDPGKLTGEKRRLFNIISQNGGLRKFKGADDRMRIQRGLRDSFRSSIIRSGRYLEHYRKIFRDNNLPEELTLLPHLESSFQFNASSYAGAVGIWQLTKSASNRIIHVNSAVDERIDPWRSAEAAARIFKDNYRRLKNWPLTVTAYNQGVNAMRRAVKQVGSKGIDKVVGQYRSRNFGFAGRNFYCAFVATLEVVQDYEQHFGYLKIDQPLPLNQHKVTKSASLKSIAKELGVNTSQLAKANPHLRSRGRNSTSRIPKGAALNIPVEVDSDAN